MVHIRRRVQHRIYLASKRAARATCLLSVQLLNKLKRPCCFTCRQPWCTCVPSYLSWQGKPFMHGKCMSLP